MGQTIRDLLLAHRERAKEKKPIKKNEKRHGNGFNPRYQSDSGASV